MIALPWPTAVTRPSDETVATASSDELQTASPAPSGATVAVSWTVSPTLVIVKVAGDTVTDCTSHVTVTWHVALLPPAVAVTVAVPLYLFLRSFFGSYFCLQLIGLVTFQTDT